jgi:hypothetical protein
MALINMKITFARDIFRNGEFVLVLVSDEYPNGIKLSFDPEGRGRVINGFFGGTTNPKVRALVGAWAVIRANSDGTFDYIGPKSQNKIY